jgi:hypothetical protein
MGGEPWSYFVPFEASVEAALGKLRRRVFEAGEFRGSEMEPATPEEAMENAGDEGTGSILDVVQVSGSPDFCSVCPLPDAQRTRLFGTEQPTHRMVESSGGLFDDIGRGQGVYVVVHKEGGAE